MRASFTRSNPDTSCQLQSVQGSLAAALVPKPPGGSSACATLGTVQRGPGGLTVAWRHDALDEASPAGDLPMECAEISSLQSVHFWLVQCFFGSRMGYQPHNIS